MQSFRMHEIRLYGDTLGALAHRESWIALATRLLSDLGLTLDTVVANDPFFGRVGNILANGQLEKELKFEVTAPISSPNPGSHRFGQLPRGPPCSRLRHLGGGRRIDAQRMFRLRHGPYRPRSYQRPWHGPRCLAGTVTFPTQHARDCRRAVSTATGNAVRDEPTWIEGTAGPLFHMVESSRRR